MSAVARGGALAIALAVTGASAAADSTSGIDAVLQRSAYDANGAFAVEGGRLLPARDLSLKAQLALGRAPIAAPVPGIGDGGDDRILDDLLALDLAFAMTLVDRVALGIAVGAYRTSPGAGYGDRGRYGDDRVRSTGLVALRPLSNFDPSASPSDATAYTGVGRAGPLDARFGLKVALLERERLAIAALGTVALPFGEDEMLLGDRGVVLEPAVAAELRATPRLRVLAHVAARLRKRTILEGYDAADAAQSADDARVFLDVGSEAVLGAALVVEATEALALVGEAQLFVPLPESATYGRCVRYSGARCASIDAADYVDGVGHGDRAAVVAAGARLRVSHDVAATLLLAASPLGARGESVRVATGLVWAPTPAGTASRNRRDGDADGVPDLIDRCDAAEDLDAFEDDDGCPEDDNDRDGLADAGDRCPDDSEDLDAFEDGDGCPELDNDRDAIPDASDRCPQQAEDVDGFEDTDGCTDEDNDRDGFVDAADRCPDDAETVNGVDDDDGCPDVRGAAGPKERADRIDLEGAQITFAGATATLTAASQALLQQVAMLVKARKLSIRVEVHVATKARRAGPTAAQRAAAQALSQRRAKAILDALLGHGVPLAQVQAVGLGAARPLGGAAPSDPANERVDFIKAQQGGVP